MASVSVEMASSSDQSIVVGGGQAGMSAANTVLENGGRASEGKGRSNPNSPMLCESGPDVEWLMDKFCLDLSLRFACVSQSSIAVRVA